MHDPNGPSREQEETWLENQADERKQTTRPTSPPVRRGISNRDILEKHHGHQIYDEDWPDEESCW